MPHPYVARRDPEALLRQIQAQEQHQSRGRLKIFLGYSSGVGKSFRMLDEGRRRLERGEDVVVGALQLAAPEEVECLLRKFEIIPMKEVEGAMVMNVPAILRRHPQICLVDGLAYDNPPGSRNAKRWQDVEELLDAGISVGTAVNVQYVEERREEIERITGKTITQTVPLSFFRTADEIEVVDLPPEMCIERAGEDGKSEPVSPGRQKQLSELREIALLLVADVVDRKLESYLEVKGIEQTWGALERILVLVTPDVEAARMLESGRRNADRFHGELAAVYMNDPDLAPKQRAQLDANLALARRLGAQVVPLDGEDPVVAVMEFARSHGITQIFAGNAKRANWWDRIWGGDVDRLIREAEGIDVRVFPN